MEMLRRNRQACQQRCNVGRMALWAPIGFYLRLRCGSSPSAQAMMFRDGSGEWPSQRCCLPGASPLLAGIRSPACRSRR